MKLRSLLLAVIVFVSLHLATTSAQKNPPQKLNVLFIAVDDLRPELGCYGFGGTTFGIYTFGVINAAERVCIVQFGLKLYY